MFIQQKSIKDNEVARFKIFDILSCSHIFKNKVYSQNFIKKYEKNTININD